jgi:hypothetical protein
MTTTVSSRPMPREGDVEELVEYLGYQLGRAERNYWAIWHAGAGWHDTGEATLEGAKSYLIYLNDM